MSKIISIISLILLGACSNRVNIKTQIYSNKESQKNIFVELQDSIMIRCKGEEQKLRLDYDRYSNNYYADQSILKTQLKCIGEGAFKGDNGSIWSCLQILENLNWINPYLKDDLRDNYKIKDCTAAHTITQLILSQNWRGSQIFQKLLEVGNNYGCYKISAICEFGPPESCFWETSIHEPFFTAYTSMIRSIDGNSVKGYLEISVPTTYERTIKDDQDLCHESIYLEYYQVILDAYRNGKIVLKDFGDD